MNRDLLPKHAILWLFRRSTRPEVAQVHLINSTDGECASRARVSAISKTPHQMTTVILAENKGIHLLTESHNSFIYPVHPTLHANVCDKPHRCYSFDNCLYFVSVTKEILRCNVIVSEIVRLEIETTTRLLYLEDSPEELIARGYDSEGTLYFTQFDWDRCIV